MAKVNITTHKVTAKIQKAFDDLIASNEVYLQISNFTVERIQQKARLQKRMIQDGDDNAPLPNLSDPYKKYRRALSAGEEGTDPKFFLPNVNKSQLTFTGNLLKSLSGRILRKGASRGSVEVSTTENRTDGETNANIYRNLTDRNKGYNILGLSKKAIERIRTLVLNQLRRQLIKNRLK